MSKCYLLLREWKKRIPQRQLSQIRYCHPGLASVSGKETSHCPPGPCPAPFLSERGRGPAVLPGTPAASRPPGKGWGPGARRLLRGSPEAVAAPASPAWHTDGEGRLTRVPKAPRARACVPGQNGWHRRARGSEWLSDAVPGPNTKSPTGEEEPGATHRATLCQAPRARRGTPSRPRGTSQGLVHAQQSHASLPGTGRRPAPLPGPRPCFQRVGSSVFVAAAGVQRWHACWAPHGTCHHCQCHCG